jgi:hypothetical protein
MLNKADSVRSFDSSPAMPLPVHGKAKEKDPPLPSDTAEIGGLKGTFEDREKMRRASIEHFPLHAEALKKAGENKVQQELGKLSKIINDWDIDRIKGKIPTVGELTDAFQKPANDPSIPWEYLPDGCYARAHVTCKDMLDKGFNVSKMYVMIDGITDNPFFPMPSYRLKTQNKFTEGEWWYHVAPVVFAKDEKTGEVDGYILDAAVSKKPQKATDWIKNFWSQDFPILFDMTHADIYEPHLESNMPGLPHEFSQKKFDRLMPEALQTNKEYNATLHKIKEEYYALHPGEKPDDRA